MNVAETVAIAAGGAPSHWISQVKVPAANTVMVRVPETGSAPTQPSPDTPWLARHAAAWVVVHLSVTASPATRVGGSMVNVTVGAAGVGGLDVMARHSTTTASTTSPQLT